MLNRRNKHKHHSSPSPPLPPHLCCLPSLRPLRLRLPPPLRSLPDSCRRLCRQPLLLQLLEVLLAWALAA